MKTNLINHTEDVVSIQTQEGRLDLEPTEPFPYCSAGVDTPFSGIPVTEEEVEDTIPILLETHQILNLPPYESGILRIVSCHVAELCSNRDDLLYLGDEEFTLEGEALGAPLYAGPGYASKNRVQKLNPTLN